jgi:hypothetical protein
MVEEEEEEEEEVEEEKEERDGGENQCLRVVFAEYMQAGIHQI